MFGVTTGDALDWLRGLPGDSHDALLCDPPYGLSDHTPDRVLACLSAWVKGKPYAPKGHGFLGCGWDAWVPGPEVWKEALRVLKPGAPLLAFAGTRSMDLMSMAIRLAGFELRDSIGYAHDGGGAPIAAWVQSQGMPKSLNVSKAMDKKAGAARAVVGRYRLPGRGEPWDLRNARDERTVKVFGSSRNNLDLTAAATDAARRWEGYGTGLAPKWEPIILARKPLDGTVTESCAEHGCGALNIDGCRIPIAEGDGSERILHQNSPNGRFFAGFRPEHSQPLYRQDGRWPGNVIHDGSDAVLEVFAKAGAGKDDQAGARSGTGRIASSGMGPLGEAWGGYGGEGTPERFFLTAPGDDAAQPKGARRITGRMHARQDDSQYRLKAVEGSVRSYGDGATADRFFYAAKASKRERSAGLPEGQVNRHECVKPLALTEYLARLVLPPARETPRRLLVPFAGSGSEMLGALRAGWDEVHGCERDPGHATTARRRCAAEQAPARTPRKPAKPAARPRASPRRSTTL